MTLEEYLIPGKTRLSKAELAAALAVSQITVNRWLAGTRFPDRDTILAVEKVTGGKVMPADWYKVCSPPDPRPSIQGRAAQ